ncbi:hypothetical protein [Streptomyces noursei]|uniref:hypothetical protein n=1 Tax=Streptomyces noursei TaxID=1971 RepID=UPI0019629CE2|nr:hypothetical protein [Streptomyces noursei]QRX92406.1 hypothetical protein JNO44_17450 [Streptomyces noursei]
MSTDSTARHALANAAPPPRSAHALRTDTSTLPPAANALRLQQGSPIGWDAVPSLKMWTVDEITGNACPCCHCVYSLVREKISGPDGRHSCRLCAAALGVPVSTEATL